MVDFRRMITALAVLALFAGLAGAQVGIPSGPAGLTPFSCTTQVVTPQIRAEGFTELVGDVVLTCTGGNPIVVGTTTAIPTANIFLYTTAPVTSRLLASSGGASEALLMIDEPQSGLTGLGAGYGPALPLNACSSAASGCPAYVGANGQAATVAGGSTAAPNVYQGIVSNGVVQFNGVPILPPATAGLQRVFRITNVRVNANAIGGGSATGLGQVTAQLVISAQTSVPITNSNTFPVAYVVKGLSTSFRDPYASNGSTSSAWGLSQCLASASGGNTYYIPTRRLRYSEGFPNAFKTRIAGSVAGGKKTTDEPLFTNMPALFGVDGSQAVPGYIYKNAESNFVMMVNGGKAGLADYGTRLRATFTNIPAGMRVFVTTSNAAASLNTDGTPNPSNTLLAQMVVNDTITDGQYFQSVPGAVPSKSLIYGLGGTLRPVQELQIVGNSATAIWEVTASDPATAEDLDFDVYVVYTGNPSANSPAPGLTNVAQSFAPVPGTLFTATTGGAASFSLPLPRFADTAGAGVAIWNVTVCRTILLFPYITNDGFDTGIAISNTSSDPLGTTPQNGKCDMTFYGKVAVPAPVSVSILAGQTGTALASSALPTGFSGYMIAICNFQYAHGFAFVSDFGAQKLAMGYLSLIIPDPGVGYGRVAGPTWWASSTSGENLGQ